MSLQGRHIYCIIESGKEEQFPGEGIGENGSEIYSVPAGDIAAVVGESMSGSPLTMRKEELIKKLAAHQSVVEHVMKKHAVLPVKFGTTARDNDEVASILLRAADQFRGLFDYIRGKIEEDVVAFWSKKALEDLLREKPEIKKARDEVSAMGKNAPLEDVARVGQMIAAELAGRKEKCVGDIIDCLKECSLDMRRNRIARDDMILNAAFLLREGDQKLFDDKVVELNDRFEDRIDFRCVGPLPPYSFSTVEVSRFSFEEIDAARKRLGLGTSAEPAAIKEAHLKLIPKLHPDRRQSDPDAGREFEEASKAFQLLSRYCGTGEASFNREDVEKEILIKVLEIEGQPEMDVEVKEAGDRD
ncbi:MAG: GvpL/GvpF family gas vesicle protein [Actinobacteria bacterium]|nr:GvpL/GvpF family gas vesicle protein [Actinomycetota bacterium]MBU4403766.1 GvpL/GvpF family gas vesicle protein [Actinomycetota bacterium]MCG2819307.1 GvpL/GvpF family gas vesicle protein [Actinomycetes bacterium]